MTIAFETERLVLKRFAIADAQGFYELNLDPEVIRYTGDAPFRSVEEAKSFIRGYDHYDRYGYGRWSVFIRATGEYKNWACTSRKPLKPKVRSGTSMPVRRLT